MDPLKAIHEGEDGLYRCYTVKNGRHFYQPNNADCLRSYFFRELYRQNKGPRQVVASSKYRLGSIASSVRSRAALTIV